MLTAAIVVLNGLVVLAVVNSLIARKQAIVDTGQTVFLELAPVDPRSLMQGDHMALAYALPQSEAFAAAAGETNTAATTRGRLILALDERRVGTFARFDGGGGDPPGENEAALRYRKWRRGWKFGIESFFFQEGMADVYEEARFAELRVRPDGRAVLVGLAGENLDPLDREGVPPAEAAGDGGATGDPPDEAPPP